MTELVDAATRERLQRWMDGDEEAGWDLEADLAPVLAIVDGLAVEWAVEVGKADAVYAFGGFNEYAKAEAYQASYWPNGRIVRRLTTPWSPSVPDTEEGS